MDAVLEAVKRGEFTGTVAGAGVVRIWETRRVCMTLLASRERAKVVEFEQELRAKEAAELGEEAAEARANERGFERRSSEMFGNVNTPLWRVVSGIFPGMNLDALHPNERAGRLTLLIRAVEKIVRYEWRAFEKMKADRLAGTSAVKVDDPRVRWWDPMRLVCEHFGIAYSALSRFSREVAGLAASDLTDRVKAETVRVRMKEDVKRWVDEIYAEERLKKESELLDASPEDAADWLWSRVAEKRGRGRWSRAAWAGRFGYSSYTKFQRACLAEHGVSPVELERSVLEEVVRERVEQVKVAGATGAVLERAEGEGRSEGTDVCEEGGVIERGEV